jgi:hypothetical protein
MHNIFYEYFSSHYFIGSSLDLGRNIPNDHVTDQNAAFEEKNGTCTDDSIANIFNIVSSKSSQVVDSIVNTDCSAESSRKFSESFII